MKCDELEKFDATSNADRSAGIESRYAYDAEEVDEAIEELKGQVNGLHNRANLWEYNAQNEHNAAVEARMENAKLKAKADKLLSCLKCLVMRDLIKDCPEKESAIEIVKEYK